MIAHAARGKSSGFGALSQTVATMEMPADPPVKDPSAFTLIGTDRPCFDSVAKSNDTAQFTMDVYRNGMLTVVVAHPPKLGAVVAILGDKAALAIPGVEMVRQISSGVAGYATGVCRDEGPRRVEHHVG